MKKVAIIGQGYVGLTIAVFASKTHNVIGYDNSKKIVEQLNKGISHIEGIQNAVLKSTIYEGNYRASSDGTDIADADVVIIAVPTPLDKDRKPDLSYIESACKTIADNILHPILVINESTSFPGTIRNFIKPLIENLSPTKIEHLYAISPERVDPGRVDWDQKNTPRLFAGLTVEASKRTREFYASFCNNLVEVSSPEVAEAAKLFENTFRQVNIALVNELAVISHALGISVRETLEAANTKPYGFMKFNPSAGVGGHCIPVDPSYLAYAANQQGVKAKFIELANMVNLEMPNYIVSRLAADHGGNLKSKKVLIIGVSYKSDIADVRETPAANLIIQLKEMGAKVSWHDDVVKNWEDETSTDPKNFDIAILVTRHSYISNEVILNSAEYVFDCTGSCDGAIQL